MAQVALGLWVMTMIGGGFLFSYTWGVGRPESTARATALPQLAMFVHPVLAGTGFLVWVLFMASQQAYLAWAGVGFLVAAALVGDVLTLRTVKPKKVVAGPGHAPADLRRAEEQMPKWAIVAHGALAVATIVTSVIAAIGASG